MEETHLTASEWNVLNCLWERHPQTVMQDKGLVLGETVGKGKSYSPAVEREGAAADQTRSFLDRVYQGSVGLMMSAMARRQELTREEIAELKAILDEAERGSAQ